MANKHKATVSTSKVAFSQCVPIKTIFFRHPEANFAKLKNSDNFSLIHQGHIYIFFANFAQKKYCQVNFGYNIKGDNLISVRKSRH